MTASKETGAPAALARLETHELKCAQEVDRLKAELVRLRAMQEPEGDDAARLHRQKIQDAVSNLSDAQEDWAKSLKSLREFDKAVSPEKREGEKILRREVEEWFRQLNLSLSLAIEAYIISLSQEASRVESPEEFHIAHAEALRSCKATALDAAIRDGRLPVWAAI